MKVLYILHTAQMHGSTISFLNMVKGLTGLGVDVSVILPEDDKSPALPEALGAAGISDVHYARITNSWLPFLKDKSIKGCLSLASKYIKLRIKKALSYHAVLKIARAVRPDIIHTNVGVVQEGYAVARKLHIPHVFHIREYQDDFRIIPSKARFECMLKDSTTITITHLLQSYFNLDREEKAFTIYNGIQSKDSICYSSEKKKEFLCASRVSLEKGIGDVISAFGQFYRSHPDYRLVIAGDGEAWCMDLLRNHAQDCGCQDAVTFTGFVKDVPERMKTAKALIVASYLEPFGRMTAEAVMNGCMVVGRDTGGTKEIMDAVGGALRFNDTEELISCMETVASMDKKEYEGIILPAQKKSADLFSTEQNIENIYSVYRRITRI